MDANSRPLKVTDRLSLLRVSGLLFSYQTGESHNFNTSAVLNSPVVQIAVMKVILTPYLGILY